MFEEITLSNFRTHKLTRITLGPVTLIIGNNNAGKTNLLAGIQHFSRLIARGRPDESRPSGEARSRRSERRWLRHIRDIDLFQHRHRLAPSDEPMAFSCKWASPTLGKIQYRMELYPSQKGPRAVGCREAIQLCAAGGQEREYKFGWDKATDTPGLNAHLATSDEIDSRERELCNRFFRDAASCFSYHFQPAHLKGRVERAPGSEEAQQEASEGGGQVDADERRGERLVIHSQLGYEGGNLHKILAVLEERDRRTYDRLIANLRRFESSFHGILVDRRDPQRERVLWQFDMREEGQARVDQFSPEVVSDGLLRAAPISLLTAMAYPPAIIQIEEIENGLNPGNIDGLVNLLWQAVGAPDSSDRGYATQFVLTSHSPSVLREFCDHLDYIYNVRLDKGTYISDVRNLSESLEALVGLGGIPGELVERDGRKVVKLLPHQLTELWYSGTFG